jgi:hypothetical protein
MRIEQSVLSIPCSASTSRAKAFGHAARSSRQGARRGRGRIHAREQRAERSIRAAISPIIRRWDSLVIEPRLPI